MSNDDSALVRPELNLFVVADGAGHGGHVASSAAISAIASYFERTDESATLAYDIDGFGYFSDARRLASAIHHANDQIVAIAHTSSDYRMMGSTVAACSFSPDIGAMHVASVGDSRCYRFRAGVLEQLTDDHSLLHDAIALRPDMCDEELVALPTHLVTRVLGTAEGLRVYTKTFEVTPGDRILLCSDGLTNSLDTATLRTVMAEVSDPGRAAEALVARAFAEGAEDNVAVIVVDASLPSGASLLAPRRAPRPIALAHQAECVTEMPHATADADAPPSDQTARSAWPDDTR
jgi:protein phosphatase